MAVAAAAACIVILAAKFFLAARININWDEFYFLSNVYALARGELDLFLQGAYTHAFLWITSAGGNELDQIVRLRVVMCVLLVISAGLTWLLARLYASWAAAWIALLAFLAAWPVLKHGASFRADSILLPLTLAAFYFVLRRGIRPARDALIGGIFLGLTIVVTVKAMLLVPAMVLMAALPDTRPAGGQRPAVPTMLRRLAAVGFTAVAVAGTLLLLHRSQVIEAAEPATAFASRTLAAVLGTELVPRGELAWSFASNDAAFCLALIVGLVLAVSRGMFGAAAAILCLAPLFFYRNSFPYYFPVMMAPAAVLIAVAADWMLGLDGTRAKRAALAVIAIGCLAWMHAAWDGIAALRFDGQSGQRAVIAAVHQVFLEPVPYIDHSGMVASFPKANFFMSSWGVERYLARGEDFMPEILRRRCAPLLLVNHSVLKPGALLFRGLRSTDQALLESRYVPYWGPIRLAGAVAEIPAGHSVTRRVPCPGRYRASVEGTASIEGRPLVDGDVVILDDERGYQIESAGSSAVAVTLQWADAEAAPAENPPRMPIYSPL